MQQFIENAEKECEDEDSELEAKCALDTDAKSARQDSVKALRKLFEDFEAHLNLQEEEDQEVASLSDSQEEAPSDILSQPEQPLAGYSSVLPAQEHEEEIDTKGSPSSTCAMIGYVRWKS